MFSLDRWFLNGFRKDYSNAHLSDWKELFSDELTLNNNSFDLLHNNERQKKQNALPLLKVKEDDVRFLVEFLYGIR